MPITRSQSAGADNAAHLEEVETSATSGSGELRELRGQLAALTDKVAQQTEAARRQEARMKRLEDLLLQQAEAREAQVPTPPVPVEVVAPRGSSPILDTSRTTPAVAPREEVIAAPPAQERDRLMERLNEFRRCSTRIFDGEKVDHRIVEKWLMHMEKLFRDTFVEERNRVWLATHHLDGEAYRWWLDIQENPSTDLAAISWKKFKELLLAHYFPDSVKRKIEQDLRNLCQGDRTVAEYEREFSRLLHCVPFVVRDDEDKARIFERGLRPSIFRFVQSSNLQTYQEVVNRALIVESGVADLQERREGMDKGKGKRPAAEGASQMHSRRSPKHPRSQCYQCVQEGHVRTECPRGSSSAPSTASAPALPADSQGTPLAQYQPGRPSVQRQSEGSRQAPSGGMYAAQTEEAAAAEDVIAGIILLDGIRVRALFDTGASHSFIDRLFVELHGIPFIFLLHPGQVVVPDHTLDIQEFCPSCPVRVGDWIMPVDLLALRKLGEFDVVLGMDWLTKYYATVDCKNRMVTFREPGQTEVIFRGCQSSLFAMTISSSRARQLISRGCIAYLASVVVRGDDDTPRIEDIRWCGSFRTCFQLSYRVLWSNHEEREASWELESALQERYPHLFRWSLEREKEKKEEEKEKKEEEEELVLRT
uniref:CCHC-type domain-containing protein n=1 Tax=Ananas comosus var. bracteatus TaxID=296719 RepID=A0A6V7NT00_ANACO|nr:unnamed protein product [Ananas comosus var. bracteatus]